MNNSRTRAAARAFPWDEAMRLGFGVLRRSSAEFWAMTPRELKQAADGVFGRGGGAPTRASLDDLIHEFPDGER